MSAPHQQVVQNIQSSSSYSNVGRHNEPSTSLLTTAGKHSHIAPLRDPRDASKRKRTTNEDVAILAQQGLYAEAAESIRHEAHSIKTANSTQSLQLQQAQQSIAAHAASQRMTGIGKRISSAPADRPSSAALMQKIDLAAMAIDAAAGIAAGKKQQHHSTSAAAATDDDDDNRNDTLISSGRPAVVKNNRKKRAGSATLPHAVQHQEQQQGKAPIVEALYTPSVEFEKCFLVKERIRMKNRKLGCHAKESAAFRAKPRPGPADDETKRQAPPVGAYHPQRHFTEHRTTGFYFDSPARSRSRNQNNNKNNDNNNNNNNRGDDLQLDNTTSFGFASMSGLATPSGGPASAARNQNNNAMASATMRFASSPHHHSNNNNNSSGGGATMTAFGLTGTFNSNMAQDASLRGFRGNIDPRELRAKVQDGQNPNRDLEEMQRQQHDQQNMQRAHPTDLTPQHQSFSAVGTSSFVSKAPRFAPEPRDKLEYPDTPWPLMSPSSKPVRPTGGGAIGAPLGREVIPPDVPQPHQVSMSRNLQERLKGGNNNSNNNTPPGRAATPQPTTTSTTKTTTPVIGGVNYSLPRSSTPAVHGPYGGAPPPPAPGSYSMPRDYNDSNNASNSNDSKKKPFQHKQPAFVARTRRTFLDGLVSPAYNERPPADDSVVQPRQSCGVPFNKAPGRYGHTTSTAASLRFQPIRRIGRVIDPDVTSNAPVLVASEKFIEAGSVNKISTKEDTDVLSTRHRTQSPLPFAKQKNYEHEDKARVNVNPSSVLTSPIPLDHPHMSFVHSRVPGLVALQPGKKRPMAGGTYSKKGLDVWNTTPEMILNSSSSHKHGGDAQQQHDEAAAGAGGGIDKVFDHISYPRTRSALILPQQHFHSQVGGGAVPAAGAAGGTSPNRFRFNSPPRNNNNGGAAALNSTATPSQQQQNQQHSPGSVIHQSIVGGGGANNHSNSANNNSRWHFSSNSATAGGGALAMDAQRIDHIRHARSPTAFIASTGHDSYVVHRSDQSRAENNARGRFGSAGMPQETPAIPLERLLKAEEKIQPRVKVGVDISRTISREERERRYGDKSAGVGRRRK